MSIVGIDLKGKTVLVRKSAMLPQYAEGDRRFKCEGGFGCSPSASGTAVFGTWIANGVEARIRRSDIESVIEN